MPDKEIILRNFANTLKKKRLDQGLSIRELALRSDLEYSQVQRIEKGKVNFAITTLFAIAEGLNTNPSNLLEESK